ncbi:hypothetical protein BSKO_10091 [Bryopsis sp. KO-2023]|nr:hypothetical protein BSKO_10091 [Bryopsis sp. KO-2023]
MAWMADLAVDYGRPLLNFVRAFMGNSGPEAEGKAESADATGKPNVLSVKMFDWLSTGSPPTKVAVEGDDGFTTFTPGEGFDFTEFDDEMCAPGVALVLPPCLTQGRPAEIEILVEPMSVATRVVGSCGDKVFLDRRVSVEETKLGIIRAKIPSFKEHGVVDVLLIPVVKGKPSRCKVVPVCVLPEAAAKGLHSIFFQMVESCERLTIAEGTSQIERKLETCKGVWRNNFADFIHDLEAFMMCCSGPRNLEQDALGEELLELFQRMLECSIHYRARGFALFLVAKAADGGIEVTGAEGFSEWGQQDGSDDFRVGTSSENGCARDSLDAQVNEALHTVRSLSHNDSAFNQNADMMSVADSANSGLCRQQAGAGHPSSDKPTEGGRGKGGRGFIRMLMDSANCDPVENDGPLEFSKYSEKNGDARMGGQRKREVSSLLVGCDMREEIGGKAKER